MDVRVPHVVSHAREKDFHLLPRPAETVLTHRLREDG